MTEVLYAPNREQVLTTNAWAFLHWLRAVRGIDLADWAALSRFAVDKPVDFRLAIAAFAGLSGRFETVLPRTASSVAADQDWVGRRPSPPNRPPINLSPATLIRLLAETLLHADIRPDDRVLVFGPVWPWRAGELQGARVLFVISLADLLTTAAKERATVLVAPAATLAETAFRRTRRRPDLSSLRTIIATGGPLSPEGRRRIYTWVKSDLMLLARTSDTFWGNPLEPVLALPPATPAFLMRPPLGPARR